MTMRGLTENAGEWLRGAGPQSDIVISTRVRLARNLAGYPFVNRASVRQREEVLRKCSDEIAKGDLPGTFKWIDLTKVEDVDRLLLVERHLISRHHAQAGPDVPRGVAIGTDQTYAVMVNEEDHLRIQVLRSGLQLTEAFGQINRLDNALEERLDFSFSQKLGYLTACPTNVGTGIRVSVMLHLPALKLTGEIEKVRRAARDMHLAIRGLYGEGSETLGDLYQISNQTTFGRAEEEILSDFQNAIVPQIIAYEQQARQAMLRQRAAMLDDKVWRAWGTLTQARVIGTEEVLGLLSHLRLGVNMGRIDMIDVRTINELFLITQPAHLQRLTGKEMDAATRREVRATVIRERLAGR